MSLLAEVIRQEPDDQVAPAARYPFLSPASWMPLTRGSSMTVGQLTIMAYRATFNCCGRTVTAEYLAVPEFLPARYLILIRILSDTYQIRRPKSLAQCLLMLLADGRCNK